MIETIAILAVWGAASLITLLYVILRYRKLLAKYKIVADELCGYLDDDIKEESEWGNVR